MNALLLIGIIFALSGFKPKEQTNGDKGQVTQGYYTPSNPSFAKGKMGSTATFDLNTKIGRDSYQAVPMFEYFVYTSPTERDGQVKMVGVKTWRMTSFSRVEEFDPMNYTTENES